MLLVGGSLLGGLVLLGVGGYALYEGFGRGDAERVWLGSPTTARVVGIIGVLLGLLLLCLPIALAIVFVFGFVPV